MRAWKSVFIFVLAVGLLGYVACKGGKYSDAKDVMNQSLKTMENFIGGIDKAGDSKAVVKAINEFADDMAELKPKMMALDKKYPELKDQTKVPEELKPVMKQMEEMSSKMINAMMKLYQYAQDPDVQKAQEALNKVMSEDN